MTNAKTYPHYFKATPFAHADVYRVLSMWNVTNPAIQHAVKKLLASGERGTKDWRKDVAEARDSLQRALDMDDEDQAAVPVRVSDDGKAQEFGTCTIDSEFSLPSDALHFVYVSPEDALAMWPKVNTTALDKAYADAVNTGIGWGLMGVDFGADGKAVVASESVGVGTADHKAAQEAQNVRAAKAIDALSGGVCACGGPICGHKIGPACGTASAVATATKHEPRYFGSVDAKDARGIHGRYLASLVAAGRVSPETFTDRVLECIDAGAPTVLHAHGQRVTVDGFELSEAQRVALRHEQGRRKADPLRFFYHPCKV